MRSAADRRRRDEELVRRYLAGRTEEAFRELYRAHAPYLFGLALRICGGRRGEAEEALQEAWLRAAGKLDTFRWESALRSWLGGLVVNCCREQLRRRSAPAERRWHEAIGTSSEGRPPAEPSIGDPAPDDRLDLERALARLPEEQRAVLVLFAVEGYTHEEIGRLLGIAAGTSKSRLFEARRHLRRLRQAPSTSGERP